MNDLEAMEMRRLKEKADAMEKLAEARLAKLREQRVKTAVAQSQLVRDRVHARELKARVQKLEEERDEARQMAAFHRWHMRLAEDKVAQSAVELERVRDAFQERLDAMRHEGPEWARLLGEAKRELVLADDQIAHLKQERDSYRNRLDVLRHALDGLDNEGEEG